MTIRKTYAYLVWISVVSEKLLAAFAAIFVIKHLDHFCAIGGRADGERRTVGSEAPRRGGRLLLGRWFPAADRHARAPPRDHHTDRPGSSPIHVFILRLPRSFLLARNVVSHHSPSFLCFSFSFSFYPFRTLLPFFPFQFQPSFPSFFPLLLSILLFSPVNLLVSRFIALQLIFRSSLALLSWINTLEQTSLALTSFHRLCAHWRRLRDCFRRYWCCYSCYRQCCQRSRRCRRRNDEILLPSLVLSILATFRYMQPGKIDTFLE